MTTAADDSAVEDAFEAILAGRPVPERAAGLAAFTGAVRASATQPGRPNAALAELLATGLLADQSSPSVRTATSAGSKPSRVRTRRRSAMILPALLAKFLSAGAVAQAATGAAVVVVAVTGVGAAGALPGPVQDTFATVVATVTPLEAPTSEETTEEVVTEEETLAEDVETADEATEVPADAAALEAAALEAEVQAWALEGPADGESFSAWVGQASERAEVKDWLRAKGLTFGNVVSAWANGKGLSEEQLTALGAELDEPTDGVTEPETVVDTEVTETEPTEETEVAVTEDRGSRGNGKATGGNGNGKGNGKN